MARTAHTALIQQVATQTTIPFDWLEATVLTESSGLADAFRFEPAYYRRYIKHNPDAPGFLYGPLAACSYGLMQIMLETALEIGYKDRPERLFDPLTGLLWGTTYLHIQLDWAHGDIEQALAAYNGGRVGNKTRPFRNQFYVDKVIAKRVTPLTPLDTHDV